MPHSIETGMPERHITIVWDEIEACGEAIARTAPGDLVVLMVDQPPRSGRPRRRTAAGSAPCNRRETKKAPKRAQQLTAEAFGAEQTLFVSSGSTLSAKIITLALVSEGDEVIVGGIPVLVPGERISTPIIAFRTEDMAAGMYVSDATDPSLKSLRVIRATGAA